MDKPQNIMLNERPRNERLHIILFCLYEMSRKDKTIETEVYLRCPLRSRQGDGIDYKWMRGNVWG